MLSTPTVFGGPWWADPEAGIVTDQFASPSGCHPCVECGFCEIEGDWDSEDNWLDADGLCPECGQS